MKYYSRICFVDFGLPLKTYTVCLFCVSFSGQERNTVNQGCDMTTRRKLNCNLCANIFTTMFSLNAHMKTHPEVVFFVLQLLDGETADREGIADEAEQVGENYERSSINCMATHSLIHSLMWTRFRIFNFPSRMMIA